ncbi:hypothetical protein [Mycobacterium sp.]|uniref:hypothetical protein n=1 Tax=Mycobacterium sp. TaxID=1785 RepID=UPI003C78E931
MKNGVAAARRRPGRQLRASARNYLRVMAATGQTRQPFLGRWLVLTAAMFGGSAVTYLVRAAIAGRRSGRVCS